MRNEVKIADLDLYSIAAKSRLIDLIILVIVVFVLGSFYYVALLLPCAFGKMVKSRQNL